MTDETDNPQDAEPVGMLDSDAPVVEDDEDNEDLMEVDADDESDDAEEADETEEEEQDDEPESSMADVEYEGKSYKVPPELKDAILRQSDYTRKTQEIAHQRESLQTQEQQFGEERKLFQENFQAITELAGVDQQISAYNEVNWQKLQHENPQEFQRLDWQRRQLIERRDTLAHKLNDAQTKALQEQQSKTAKLQEEGRAVLAREIPDWSPETATKLHNYAVSQGYSQQQLAGVTNPKVWITMDKARRYDETQAARSAKTAKAPAPKKSVKPVKPLKAKSQSAAPDPEKMSDDQWLKWREKQVSASRR